MFCLSTFALSALLDRPAGEVSSAEATLSEGLGYIAVQRAMLYAPDALDVAGALRADVGADTDAVRFFAAAARGREQMGIVSRLAFAWDVSSEIDAVRERMDEDVFAEAWSTGDALSLEDAVALALRGRLGAATFDEAWASGEALPLEDAVAYALRGRGPRQRPAAGWDSLTPTELKVVELVAEGLSNPQVAERLIMSPRTVSTHLSHVFAKLGVSSRGELAAAALKRR